MYLSRMKDETVCQERMIHGYEVIGGLADMDNAGTCAQRKSGI